MYQEQGVLDVYWLMRIKWMVGWVETRVADVRMVPFSRERKLVDEWRWKLLFEEVEQSRR